MPLRRLLAAFGVAAALAGSPAGAADDGRSCPAIQSFANPKLLSAMQRGVNLPLVPAAR